MCRIMTSNYRGCITENGISISGDKGRKIGFQGNYLSEFAPKKDFWIKWHDCLGKVSEEESILYYIDNYYKEVLSNLDPKEMLEKIPKGSILLCYENNEEFCHRHLVAFWFELFLGISSSEVIENPRRETVKRTKRPEYLKPILEAVIKANYDMNGFDNIKDAYEYNNKEIKIKELKMV